MRKLISIITAGLLTVSLSAPVFAALPDVPSFDSFSSGVINSAPVRQYETRGQDDEEDVFIPLNPYMSYIPYVYVKGGITYSDFHDLPDFAQFARLDGDKFAVYPSVTESFSYVGAPYNPNNNFKSIDYNYSSIIIDYFDVPAASLKNYKTHIANLGFKLVNGFKSALYPEYVETINEELQYDTDFKLDKDGVFIIENDDGFYFLLIGRSVGYDKDMKLRACVEFRFYSLKGYFDYGLNILDEAGNLNPPGRTHADGASVNLFTPDASDDINAAKPPQQSGGLSTPNAVDDINTIINPPK